MDQAVPEQKPDRLTAIAVMTLISGIVNLFWSIGIFLLVAAFGVGTLLIGCICLPLGFYPLALGNTRNRLRRKASSESDTPRH